MRSFLDAKAMAKTLRQELQHRKIELGHSECLEVVAKQFGFRDWNTMAAQMPSHLDQPASQDGPWQELPSGWFVTGSRQTAYDTGLDSSGGRDGRPALAIRCRPFASPQDYPGSNSFATIMQVVTAAPYRGKHISFSAHLRCEDVIGSATIWMRIDNARGVNIAFDNREQAPIDGSLKGTQDWCRRRVILPVPEEAEAIHFGFYLSGNVGRAWASDLSFEIAEGPSTTWAPKMPESPQNLDLQVA